MASLRSIINLDDDHAGPHPLKKQKESVPKASEQSDPLSASPSSYASLANLSIYSSPSARGQGHTPALHPLCSSAAEASPSPFALTSPSDSYRLGRRPSNASTDSMDSPYSQPRRPAPAPQAAGHVHAHAHSHSHAAAYAATPTRPLVPSSDMPVKLTPVTKRPSRAKKGLAVHVCEICRPPKTFTRAEHLRRHKSSSHQPPDLPCSWPDCDKIFHRKDLLDRHFQKHSSEQRADANGFDVSSQLSQVLGTPPSNSHGLTGQSHSAPLTSTTWAPVGSSSHSMQSHDDFSLGPSVKSEFSLSTVTPSSSAPMFSGASPDNALGLSMGDIPISEVDASGVGWAEGPGMLSDSRSNFSTPPSDGRRGGEFPLRTSAATEWTSPFGQQAPITTGLQSPLTGGYNMGFYPASSPHLYSPMFGQGAGGQMPGFDDSIYGSPVPNAAAVRSLSPHMAMEPASETLTTTPAPLPADRILTPLTLELQPETMFGLLTPQDIVPVSPSREALEAVPHYLEVYWDEVSPQYPFIHRAMLDDEAMGCRVEQLDVLKCAMAAVATQFLGRRADRINGSQLHDFASHKSKQFTQSTAAAWPLPILHAVALCEYYARFRGRSKEAYRPSSRFTTACQMVANSQHQTFADAPPPCTLLQRWTAWIRHESYRRLLAACFLLSVHGSWYYEQPLPATLGLDRLSPMMLSIPLSARTQHLWEAEDGPAWARCDLAAAHTQTVGEVLREQLSARDIDSMPAFDASILLAAHALRLPRRSKHTDVDIVENVAGINVASLPMLRLFQDSPSACTYLALHHTPLHWLLSVSGDSWVFNKKVHQASHFVQHQRRLHHWRHSGSAVLATLFAARALLRFLRLHDLHADTPHCVHASTLPWREISDYWAIYVCALICWAWSQDTPRRASPCLSSSSSSSSASSASSPTPSSRRSAVRWIQAVAVLEPAQLAMLGAHDDAHGVVGLVRDVLERDCLGGRSLLYTDAVDVLRKLEEVENWKWF
ncbi:hypothetical protein CDD81_3950 [Ophiocordyceps australis]|uniref:C2H2-type domain-containing protein n=1 Tax=Ophiocordyceps australis TaxID=1399860 RepID=A0A2C5XP00_9HYPO|nr:hypothetical protein CDD81_3950 [Ophiocordyceps australis]